MSHVSENPRDWDLSIEAGKSERHYWRDIWRFRELFGFLAWRDILARYKQTVFGVLWSIVQPVLTMVVFSIIFGRVANLPSDGWPYPILVYSAMLPWRLFSTAFSASAGSLVGSASLISKVYFPRLIIPTSKVIVSFVDFLISFAIYVVMMVYYGIPFTTRILTLPALLALAMLTALGTGLLVCALNVRYRDFRYVIPFALRFGMYVSPVAFSSSVVPEQWRFLYSLNPMVGVIEGFRWALLGKGSLAMPGFVISVAFAMALITCGIWYFRRTERTFADVI